MYQSWNIGIDRLYCTYESGVLMTFLANLLLSDYHSSDLLGQFDLWVWINCKKAINLMLDQRTLQIHLLWELLITIKMIILRNFPWDSSRTSECYFFITGCRQFNCCIGRTSQNTSTPSKNRVSSVCILMFSVSYFHLHLRFVTNPFSLRSNINVTSINHHNTEGAWPHLMFYWECFVEF